jgi:hypothetical protein
MRAQRSRGSWQTSWQGDEEKARDRVVVALQGLGPSQSVGPFHRDDRFRLDGPLHGDRLLRRMGPAQRSSPLQRAQPLNGDGLLQWASLLHALRRWWLRAAAAPRRGRHPARWRAAQGRGRRAQRASSTDSRPLFDRSGRRPRREFGRAPAVRAAQRSRPRRGRPPRRRPRRGAAAARLRGACTFGRAPANRSAQHSRPRRGRPPRSRPRRGAAASRWRNALIPGAIVRGRRNANLASAR